MRLTAGLVLLVAGAAHAFGPAQIDRAASRAHNGLRTVVRKLAEPRLAGRTTVPTAPPPRRGI
jgi:hypothetical protein